MLADTLRNKNRRIKKTFYGAASLVAALISNLFLGVGYVITVIDISPSTFFDLNNLTYMFYCGFTPVAFCLGVWGLTRKNDSTVLSVMAMGLVGLPFVILFWQFVTALIKYN